MAYQDLGPKQAPVWLVLHGGPGGRGNPGLLTPFDLTRQRVIMPDQRGCGLSSPQGARRGNTLPQLVADLQALRTQLGIETWSVLGGSWGATLAVAYAASEPGAVRQLVLRGAFDGATQTARRLVRHFWPQPQRLPSALPSRALWQRVSQLLHSGTLDVTPMVTQWTAMELLAAEHGARQSLKHSKTPQMQGLARAHWKSLQRQRRRLPQLGHKAAARLQQDGTRKFSIQAKYLARRCYLAPGAWTGAIRELVHHRVPCTWVHGQHDAICPHSISLQAHASQLRRGHAGSQLALPVAGHLPTDPAIVDALRRVIQTTTEPS